MRDHLYEVGVAWVGNTGTGTAHYRAYSRAHDILAPGKPPIHGSSDPAFRGDASKWNPEELLVAALSACHQLWYLHLCAHDGLVVTAYDDTASGLMIENADGSGAFAKVVLRPRVTISAGRDLHRAAALHHEAHRMCFIANSVRFPVEVSPVTTARPDAVG